MADNKFIVGYLISKRGYGLDVSNATQLYDDIALGLVYPLPSFKLEPLTSETSMFDIGVNTQGVGRENEKRYRFWVVDYIRALKQFDVFKSGKWDAFEMYSDGSVGGHSYSESILYGFALSLIYPDSIDSQGEELPTSRCIYLNYKYPSQKNSLYFNPTPSYVFSDFDIVRDAELLLYNNITYVRLVTDSETTFNVIGLENHFIEASDSDPITGVTVKGSGYIVPTAEDFTLAPIIDQIGNRYKVSNYIDVAIEYAVATDGSSAVDIVDAFGVSTQLA